MYQALQNKIFIQVLDTEPSHKRYKSLLCWKTLTIVVNMESLENYPVSRGEEKGDSV